MPTIFDLVTAKNTKDYIENSDQKVYLGASLFPNDKQLGLELSYLKGRHGAPVVLKAAAFDANAPVRPRIGVQKIETEMPFFREQMNVKEKERQQVNTLLAGGQTQLAEAVLKHVYDDQKALVDGANATAERMRMQLLTTGKISIDSGAEGAQYDYDYEFDPSQFEVLTGTDVWSDPNSTPIQDIMRWMQAVKLANGARAIVNSATFAHLAAHESIRKDLNPLGATSIILTNDDVKNYLQRKLKLSVAIYDETFIDETGSEQKFVPDGVFTLIPPTGTLGNTVYGTTPEESDLMTGATKANVEIVNTGVAITTVKQEHPVNVQTIVSEIVLPSFPVADKVFIATVL